MPGTRLAVPICVLKAFDWLQLAALRLSRPAEIEPPTSTNRINQAQRTLRSSTATKQVDGSLAETGIAVNLEAGAAKPLLLSSSREEHRLNPSRTTPTHLRRLARTAEAHRAALPSSKGRERSICASQSISLD